MSCVTPSDCNAVGGADHVHEYRRHGEPLIEHWDGLSWTPVPDPAAGNEAELNAVSCVATDDCNALGDVAATPFATRPMAEHWNGVTWTVVGVPAPPHAEQSALSSLACHSAISCFTVGGYSTATAGRTLVEHWNGAGWTSSRARRPPCRPEAAGLDGVAYPGRYTCIAVGGYATPFGDFTLAERAP